MLCKLQEIFDSAFLEDEIELIWEYTKIYFNWLENSVCKAFMVLQMIKIYKKESEV